MAAQADLLDCQLEDQRAKKCARAAAAKLAASAKRLAQLKKLQPPPPPTPPSLDANNILARTPWQQHLNIAVAKISDTYIRAGILTIAEQYETFMLQWMEQNIDRGDVVFVDHHGKHGNRMSYNGDADFLHWTFTEFNAVGEKTICVKVQTTSWSDPSLIAAYDARARADHAQGRLNTVRRCGIDNPSVVFC